MNRFIEADEVLVGVLTAVGGPPQVLTARADGTAVYVTLNAAGALVEVATTDAR